MSPSEYSVIFVDDDPNAILLFKRAYQTANLKNPLHVFRDGQEAIDYLSRPGAASGPGVPPALMLLDLKMPRKTGFEVLEWLRRQPGLKRIVVVVMSSSNLMSDVNRAYELGCNSYLLKPGNVDQLAEMVKLINSYWLLLNRNPEVSHGPHTAPFL